MSFITVFCIERNAAGFKHLNHVKVIKLVADRKSDDCKIGQRHLRFDAERFYPLFPVLFFPEGSFADDIRVAIQQAVNGLHAQVRHADVVGVRVDEGDRQPAPPILDDGARLAGKLLPGVFCLIFTHRLIVAVSGGFVIPNQGIRNDVNKLEQNNHAI